MKEIEMKELISKHDAMDAIEEWWTNADDYRHPVDVIQALPPVQSEIIHCKHCKNWDTTRKNYYPKNYHYCPIIGRIRNGDWYCADAEG